MNVRFSQEMSQGELVDCDGDVEICILLGGVPG